MTFEQFLGILLSGVTKSELDGAVIYAIEKPVAANLKLPFPGVTIDTEREAWLAFIDKDPMANWGHPARYVLAMESRESKSYDARLPPFGQQDSLKWCVVYKAPVVPETAIHGFTTAKITINKMLNSKR